MTGQNQQLSRRDWLRFSAAGVVGGSASGWFDLLAGQATAAGRPAKSCILLWMEGGPSQQHTFDLKDGGPYQAIDTAVPGIQISEHLPQLAQQMRHVAVLRSMSTGETVHSRARFLLHSGYRQLSAEAFPCLGSISSAELGPEGAELPNFVCIDAGTDGNNGPGAYRPVPGYLGSQHAPLMIGDPAKGIDHLDAPDGAADFDDKAALLETAERAFAQEYQAAAAEAHRTSYAQAVRLMRSGRARQVFDLEQEPAALREAYGASRFGQACLLARRLVESSVPFVEITLRGWDDHGKAAEHVKRRSAYLDPAMAALLGDLQRRGLLESTLLIWMGEFGRTPGGGGNHFARAWSTLLAGGGLKTGQVIGRTDAKGGEVADRPIAVADFMATICLALGINYKKRYTSSAGRPVRIVEEGEKPITQLLG